MTSQDKISYFDIKERNIFDTRFTGCGKTTSAIEYISEVVGAKRPVIVLMQSYERLENNYHAQFDESLQARTVIFKGRSQPEMCTHSIEYQKLWKDRKTPKNECEKCPDSKKCKFQNQLKELTKFKESKEGFILLTTEKNLNKILSEINDPNPVLIIDDISLSSVVMPESEITSYDLQSLVRHLHKQGSKARYLHDLALILTDFTEGKESEIISYITVNYGQLLRELQQFLTDHSGNADLPGHPALSFIYLLIIAVKSRGKLHFYSEYNKLKVVADDSSKYNSIRICYLNATPSVRDEYCIRQLGDYKHLTAKVDDTKRYFIFQIVDSATTKQAILDPKKIKKDFLATTDVIKNALRFIAQPLLLFAHREVFQKWVTTGILSGLDYSPEIYFGSGTRGTNDYKNYPISFVLGTPYYPPEYFLHPAFEQHWKSKEEIAKEREKNPKGFLCYVNRDISDQEAKINILQMIGRNLRDSPNNPDAVKVVVVFSDIDIVDDCKKQNGGTVIKWNIRREMPVFRGKKGDAPKYKKYRKACQAGLKSQIVRRIEEHIDKMLNENPDESYSVQVVASELQDQIKIYDTEWIKQQINKLYDTENKTIKKNGKSVPIAFIIKKKVV